MCVVVVVRVFWGPGAVSPFLGLGDRLCEEGYTFDLGVLLPSPCPEAQGGSCSYFTCC